MSVPALVPRHAFGLRADVYGNLHFAEENTIVYPCGHNVVLYNTEGKVQKLIPGSADSDNIMALALSFNKKHLAVAEHGEKVSVSIYDLQTLKRRKVLVSADPGTKDIVSMAFSPDGRLLATQGGGPDWNLTMWVWEKSKIAASTKTTNQNGSPIHQILFSSGTASDSAGVLSVIGNGIFKCFKIADNNLKLLTSALTKHEPLNYTAHAWVMDGDKERVVLGTEGGELLIIEGSELKATMSTETGTGVCSLLSHSKGFVVGTESGALVLFEKEGDDKLYKRMKTFGIAGQPHKIKSLALSSAEDLLLCALSNSQLFSLNMANTEVMKSSDMNFEVVAVPFHSAEVTGIDCCIRKPLIASASPDHSVRLWNYHDKSSELVKVFAEEAYSVALHPTGLSMLVGFADKLRLMVVLMDDLRVVKEFGIKACRECRFSHGGQMFAAVSGNTIGVYNTFTCEVVGNLRGHNGKVRSIVWSPDDTKLVSGGMDGAVYEWRIKDLKREKENVLKGCNYTSVAATPDNKALYAAGSDRKLKELEDTAGTGTQITKELDTGCVLTSTVLPAGGRTLFAGTDTGCLRAYKFPLTGEYQELKCCSAPISQLRMSHDENVLFAAGEDGTLFVFDVRDRDVTKFVGKREVERLPWAEEVLVTKSELEEKKQRTSELETQVNELTMQNEYQLRLKDLALNERVKELTEKFAAEADVDKTKFDILLQEKNEQEMEYEEKLKHAEERHQAKLAALDTQYQAKIMGEVERYQELAREKELLTERWDQQNSLLVESHERVIQELTQEFEQKLQEEQATTERITGEKDESEREFEEIKRQLEEDGDREIEELKERYETKLSAERDIGLRLKGENGIMKKKFNALQKDIEDQRDEIKTLFEHKKELYQTISSLEKDIAGLKKEIGDRDETIGDKEKRIYDLKKKNQELEKFKFVLDYKIKELKKQIEPREMQIANMKDQIKEMDGELERYHKNNATLDLTIGDFKLKQNGLQKEVVRQRSATQDGEQTIRRFQHDLEDAIQHIQDPHALKEAMKKLYQRHCSGTLKHSGLEEEVQSEYTRQRQYLEKTVDSLKHKLHRDSEQHRTENVRIMQENVALIKEINELRREVKTLKHTASSGSSTGAGRKGSEGGPRRISKDAQGAAGAVTVTPAVDNTSAELRQELDTLRRHVDMLHAELAARDARIVDLEHQIAPRPMSRERLPPMEGFAEEAGQGADGAPAPRTGSSAGAAGRLPSAAGLPGPRLSSAGMSDQQQGTRLSSAGSDVQRQRLSSAGDSPL